MNYEREAEKRARQTLDHLLRLIRPGETDTQIIAAALLQMARDTRKECAKLAHDFPMSVHASGRGKKKCLTGEAIASAIERAGEEKYGQRG